jgi:glycosyltransferase involved in cell wall biosynthesis
MKLSIIMPVYNEAEHIDFALESVLYQRVNFDYEIIVYDDNSSDDTAKIVQDYQKSFPFIKYYKNEVNLGNAKTFYNALKVASGEYFQVLDGDDFFTNWHKLERQVEFLDNNPDYCAVAHESLTIEDGKINLDRLTFGEDKVHSYNYNPYKLFNFYYHTSTFMFKNIFKHNLYKILQEDFCRGDVIRFQIIQSITNEKIKYLSFLGSVYNVHGYGIWSSLKNQEQIDLSLDFLDKRKKHLFSGVEKGVMERQIKNFDSKRTKKEKLPNLISLENQLNYLHRSMSNFLYSDPKTREYIFQNCNYFPQVDQLLESIGRICLFQNGYKIRGKKYDKDIYAFIVCGFNNANGGGIIKEIIDFVKIFKGDGKRIYIFSTEQVETSEELINTYFNCNSVKFIKAQGSSYYAKLNFLIKEIYQIAPKRLYPYVSHSDMVAGALIQKHLAEEIIMSWVYDHGTSLAVSNSSITRYIAKNDAYYYTLKSINRNNVVDIIPPSFDCKYQNLYIPFKNHKNLITASACARSYKVESDYVYEYADIIPKLLQKTNGKHFHFGPLPNIYKDKIYKEIDSIGLKKDCFVHIEWADDFSISLIDNEVDLFIAPFPIGSIRISIEANAVGIPILAHHSINRLFSSKHFLSADNFYWEGVEDFYLAIDNLSVELLYDVSKKIRNFYEQNHSIAKSQNLLLNIKSLPYDSDKALHKSFIELDIGFKEDASLKDNINKYEIKKNKKRRKLVRYSFIIALSKYRLGKMIIGQDKIYKVMEYIRINK